MKAYLKENSTDAPSFGASAGIQVQFWPLLKITALLLILFPFNFPSGIAFLENFKRRFPLRFTGIVVACSEPPNEYNDAENNHHIF
ncbi:MAG: hypothetical protein Q7J21_02415 [Rugosibacter sp.]|nr:hypothetical protein [Rugosibacter sp.]